MPNHGKAPVFTSNSAPHSLTQAERLKLLEESLGGVSGPRRPESKFSSSSRDGSRGNKNAAGKGGQATAAASEQQQQQQKQQEVDGGGASVAPGGEAAAGVSGGGAASDDNVFEILTVPDDKWISPDLPPEAGKQVVHQGAAAAATGGSGSGIGGSSSRVGLGARGALVGRTTGVGLGLPQQLAGSSQRASQRRV